MFIQHLLHRIETIVTYSADGVNENTIAFYNPVCYAYSHRRASSSSFIFKWHFAKNIP